MSKVPLYALPGLHLHLGVTTRDSVPMVYRGTSLMRNHRPLGPYRRTMPVGVLGGWVFLMSEVPQYSKIHSAQ
jgi:hypothetical protein